MADEIYYGPIKLFESEASKARKEAELNKELLDLQSKQLDVQKKIMENPDYQIQRAGELAQKSIEVERGLASQRGLSERLGTKAANVRAAATPLPAGAAGPVMPEDLAISTGQQLLEQQDLANARAARMSGELEAIRKQREGLQGSVNLGEFYGTAPAGDTKSVIIRRYQETVPLLNDLEEDIKRSKTPEEAAAKVAAAKEIKPWLNMQTRRELDNTLKIPGLGGMARDEKAAVDMRSRTSEMINIVTSINNLLALADEADKIKGSLMDGNLKATELARIQQRADLIRTPLIASLRVPITGGGPMTEQERAFLLDTVRNPTDLISIFARDRLNELSRITKKDFVGRARVAGFEINSLQQVFDAYSDPDDLETASPRSSRPSVQSEQRSAPAASPSIGTYPSESAARADGKRDYDYINVNGEVFQLLPD